MKYSRRFLFLILTVVIALIPIILLLLHDISFETNKPEILSRKQQLELILQRQNIYQQRQTIIQEIKEEEINGLLVLPTKQPPNKVDTTSTLFSTLRTFTNVLNNTVLGKSSSLPTPIHHTTQTKRHIITLSPNPPFLYRKEKAEEDRLNAEEQTAFENIIPPSEQDTSDEDDDENDEEEDDDLVVEDDTIPNGLAEDFVTYRSCCAYGGTFDGENNKVTLTRQFKKPFPVNPFYYKYIMKANERYTSTWGFEYSLRKAGFRLKGYTYRNKTSPVVNATLILTKGTIPKTLVNEGEVFINSVGVTFCIGGTKSQQLLCRKKYSQFFGCDFDELNIQPLQYDFSIKSECLKYFSKHQKEEEQNAKIWILKPVSTFHGDGMSLHEGVSTYLRKKFGKCLKKRKYIVMQYISNPPLLPGKLKWDFRTYLLIASAKPYLAFLYDEAVIRKANVPFALNFSETDKKHMNAHVMNARSQSLENHFLTFSMLGDQGFQKMGYPPGYLHNVLNPRIWKVNRFLMHTHMREFRLKRLKHRATRYHLFAMDWALDMDGNVHFLEGNENPLLPNYPKHITGITPMIWDSAIKLVLKIQVHPETIEENEMLVRKNYTFEKWSMIFNELEEIHDIKNGQRYNVCKEFEADIDRSKVTTNRLVLS